MSFLDDSDKRKGLIGTVVFHAILLFLFFIFGLTVLEPKPEEGIVINFGYTETGSGDRAEVVSGGQQQTQDEREVPENNPEQTNETAVEEVVTQDQTDAPNINDDQQEEPTPQEQEPEEPKPDDQLSNTIDDFFNTSESSSQGEAGGEGDQGDPTGDPSSPNYDGTPGGGGDGNYQLGDRLATAKPKPIYDCDAEGKVYVKIWVNQQGKVIRAEPGQRGTTDMSPCLLKRAKEAALKTKWQGDATAPEQQVGQIIYNFYRN